MSVVFEHPVRLGIVGCGAIVREAHLRVLTGHPQADLRILCDKDLRSAVLAKKEFSLEAITTDSIDAFRGQVDAAIVAVPPRYHAPVSIQLLEMGIDVLCEKPLATSAADGQKMVDTAAAHHRILAVGLIGRFHPNNDIMRRLIRSGELGELQEIVVEYGAPLDWTMTSANYYSKETTAGGVFFDLGVHLLDRALWLFDSDVANISYEDDSYGGVESNALLRGTMCVNGQNVPARFEFSWTHLLDNGIRVIGSKATAEARWSDAEAIYLSRDLDGEPVEIAVKPVEKQGVKPPPQFEAQILDFLDAVQKRRPPHVPASTAVLPLSLIERAYAVRTRMTHAWVEA